MTSPEAIDDERRALANTLAAVGPDAPTLCSPWTAFDLAAHLTSLERQGGVATFLGRSLVARGVRLNDRAGGLADRAIKRERRRGFDALVDRLRRPSPTLLLRPKLRTVGLFEVWTHHEDVAQPNGIPHEERGGLEDVIGWLLSYHAKLLPPLRLRSSTGREWTCGAWNEGDALVAGSTGDLVRWLAGRPVLGELDTAGADLGALRPRI